MDIGKYSHVYFLLDHFYDDYHINHKCNYDLKILTIECGGIPMSLINPKTNEFLIWY